MDLCPSLTKSSPVDSSAASPRVMQVAVLQSSHRATVGNTRAMMLSTHRRLRVRLASSPTRSTRIGRLYLLRSSTQQGKSQAKGCRAGWFRQSGGTPEIVGSIPEKANFRLRLKKPPRLPHVQSTVEPGLTHKATGPRVRVG